MYCRSNRAALDELINEIDIDGVRAAVGVFLQETFDRLALLRKLSCEGERTKIEDAAHALKGSSGTFGLEQVSELARMLEHSAQRIVPRDYEDLLARLEAGFERARAELEAAMAAGKGSIAA